MSTFSFLHWQNKKRLLQGVLVGLILGLFPHMKMNLKKRCFFSMCDTYVETFTEEETVWLGELTTALHMTKIC